MKSLRAVPDIAPRAVLYLRQSVHRDDSISIELQEIAGRDYCTQQGYDVVAVEADEGISGRAWKNRPAVQRVMAMVERGDAEVIVLWKWSRLSRNRRDWALAADRVDVAGGRIESATEPIDTATASGRFARGVMTEYAAFQSEQIGEQWEEVRQRRVSLGLPPSGRLPWGWHRTSKGGPIEPDADKIEPIRHMYRMYFAGHGSAEIARWMNNQGITSPNGGLWGRQRPFTVMDSPIQAGRISYRGKELPGAHQGIISDDEWLRYRALRASRTHSAPRRSTYLLSGLVVCSCGRKRVGKSAVTGGKLYAGYMCTSLEAHDRRYLSAPRVEQAVTEWVKALDVAALPVEAPTAHVDVEATAREITDVERQLVTLTKHLLSGLVPEDAYRRTRDELEHRKGVLAANLARMQSARAVSPARYLAETATLRAEWDTLPVEGKQEVVRTLISEVRINGDEMTIVSAWGSSSLMSV